MQEVWFDGGVYIFFVVFNIVFVVFFLYVGLFFFLFFVMVLFYLDGGVGCKDNMSFYDDGGCVEVCVCDGWQGGEFCGVCGIGGSFVNSVVDLGGSFGDVCFEVESKSIGLGIQKCCVMMFFDVSFFILEDGVCQV